MSAKKFHNLWANDNDTELIINSVFAHLRSCSSGASFPVPEASPPLVEKDYDKDFILKNLECSEFCFIPTMFSFQDSKVPTSKAYVSHGTLTQHVDPEQPPSKRNPFSTIMSQTFNHMVRNRDLCTGNWCAEAEVTL